MDGVLARDSEDVAMADTVVNVLWIPAGLSCDGDSVALTGAMQPSIEEIALGALPGLAGRQVSLAAHRIQPRAAQNFLKRFLKPNAASSIRSCSCIEGSIANEEIKKEGYLTGFGNAPGTDQPITFSGWIDRLAPKAWAVLAAGTCATYGGIHAMAGNPTGAMGILDYLGWDWKSSAGVPIVCVPGCPIQPDNLSETILYLLWQAAGRAPMIPLDEAGRPTWLFGNTVHEGCDRAGYYEQGEFATEYDSPKCLVKLGCWGRSSSATCPSAAGWAASADVPTSAAFASAARCRASRTSSCRSWTSRRAERFLRRLAPRPAPLSRRCGTLRLRPLDKEPKWRHKGKTAHDRIHGTRLKRARA